MTTNERFGRSANRHDSDYSEENDILLHRLKTNSSNFSIRSKHNMSNNNNNNNNNNDDDDANYSEDASA